MTHSKLKEINRRDCGPIRRPDILIGNVLVKTSTYEYSK